MTAADLLIEGLPSVLMVLLRVMATLVGLILLVLSLAGQASVLSGFIGALITMIAVGYRRIFR